MLQLSNLLCLSSVVKFNVGYFGTPQNHHVKNMSGLKSGYIDGNIPLLFDRCSKPLCFLYRKNLDVNANKINYNNEPQLTDYCVKKTGQLMNNFVFLNSNFLQLSKLGFVFSTRFRNGIKTLSLKSAVVSHPHRPPPISYLQVTRR